VDAEDETFLTLKDAIAEQVRQLDGYGMEFPKSWHELMTDLENEKRYYIAKGTYYQKCFEKGLLYEDSAREGIYEWLLDWFNDLGVCFSYHKNSNSQILDNYELLNPQWLTRAAYVLINYGKQESDNGILTRKQIETILKETEPLDFDDLGSVSYEPEQIEYILEILRKFQISYQLPDGRELIPVLCDDNSSGSARPEWFVQDEMQHTSYEFQYEYLPDTIIPVLIDEMEHSASGKGYVWPRNEDKFYENYYAVLEAAGCRRLEPYSCRHTTATALAITEGIAPQTIKKVMRWSTTKMLDKYAHPDDKDAMEALNRLAR
jgi:hypothetical protein